MKKRSSKIT